jgi:hypothetical protein
MLLLIVHRSLCGSDAGGQNTTIEVSAGNASEVIQHSSLNQTAGLGSASLSGASVMGESDFYCFMLVNTSIYGPKNFPFGIYQDPGTCNGTLGSCTNDVMWRMQISDILSDNHTGLTPFAFENVTVQVSPVQLAFCAWIIRFELTNHAQCMRVVDLECHGELSVHESFDFDRIGFTWRNSMIYFTCLCRSCPLVRNVSTYWIGSKGDLADNCWDQSVIDSYSIYDDLGAAWSWQNLSIPSGGSMTVGVVFQTGVCRDKPELVLYNTSDDVNSFSGNGTIRNVANEASCTLYVVINDDLSQLFLVMPDLVASFSINFSLSDKIVASGPRSPRLQLLFCAVDQTNGRISEGVLGWVRIPDRTQSRSHYFSETHTPGLHLAELRPQRVRAER